MVQQWQRILQVCVCGGGGVQIYTQASSMHAQNA